MTGVQTCALPIFFALFQLMFAIITPGLVVGAVAERIKFTSYTLFIILFIILVYAPLAHWSWHPQGFLFKMGALDFAGGTVVHISAGCAALAGAIVLKSRRAKLEQQEIPPANIPYVLIGTGLLWFGWFGFNAGSSLAANGIAGLAFMNTQVATAGAVIGWLLTEKIRNGHATSLGAASGAVAGLVAITPACAFVAPWAAVVIGFIAGILCALAVGLKYKFGFDDSLDVVGVHLVGGIWGSLSIGLFGASAVNSIGLDGLFYGGGTALLAKQSIGVGLVAAYSFIVTLVIGFAIEKTIGFRVSREVEVEGIDLKEHAESAYELASSSRGGASL